MGKPTFPKITKQITDFIYEEEGNIPRSKLITLSTMILLLGVVYAQEAFASHQSHSSHSSHSSHTSHVSSSHVSHASHVSSSHSSHINTIPTPTPSPTPDPHVQPSLTSEPIQDVSLIESLQIPQPNTMAEGVKPINLNSIPTVNASDI